MALFPAHVTLAELNRNWIPKAEKKFGLQYVDLGPEGITAEYTVNDDMLQPHGIMHGGFSCLVGESLGSVAGNLALNDPKLAVVGQNLQALHLRPAKAGTVLEARVQAVHVGRRSHIWETEIKEKASGKMVARITLTVAVIERPG